MSGAVHQKVATHLGKIQIAGDQIQTAGEIVLVREILKHQDKGKINYPGVAGRGRPSLYGGVPKILFELTKAHQVRPASPGSIYRGGLGMIAILVIIGTRYACHIDDKGD